MNYKDALDFVRNKMKMQHIYQPLIIRMLLDSGGTATVRQLAIGMASNDEALLRSYEARLRRMPFPVLRKHKIISTERSGLVTLNIDKMTYEQRAELRAACDEQIGQFLAAKGLSTWDYSLLEMRPVPLSVRYDVLTRDKHKCVLCGVESTDARLEVDHIKPRSHGGGNEMDNLQTLCQPCNLGKLNRDETDHRV